MIEKCDCLLSLNGYIECSGVWNLDIVCEKHTQETPLKLEGHRPVEYQMYFFYVVKL